MTVTGFKSWVPLAIVLASLLLNGTARADDRAIISAATANAVDALHDDVASARINGRLTVVDFLKQTGGDAELTKTLQRAEQLGGPRFSSDGQACQIKLEIAGQRVAHELISIAASNPDKSPIPAEALARELTEWRNRTFSGTGSSVNGDKVQFVQPAQNDDAWAGVSNEARQQAVDAARDDAVHRVMDHVRPIPFAANRTVGDVLDTRQQHDAITAWLGARPVRAVHFQPDHQIEIALAVPPADFTDQMLAGARQANLPLPDPGGEATLRAAIARAIPAAIGRASVSASAVTTAPIFAVVLPSRPPSWTQDPISAEGVAEARASKLKTARAAEAAAMDSLRAKIDALPLSAGLTLGDAARQSQRIEKAVQRSLETARPYKVDYRADGSVLVRSSLNPRELWADLSEQQ